MTALDHLSDASDLLSAERSSLVVQGRALTPEEQARLADLEHSLKVLDEVRRLLQTPRPAPALGGSLRPGRYQGDNGDVRLELRVDRDLGVASGDLTRIGDSASSYVASFRSEPGRRLPLTANRPVSVVAQDDLGATSIGELNLLAVGEDVEVVLTLEARLNGLPFNRPIEVSVSWQSESLRTLGIELDTEHGVEPLPAYTTSDGELTLDSLLASAGLEVEEAGLGESIPPKPEGWDPAELHALMVDIAQRPVERPGWELGLLLLGRATRPEGLLGVMFDTTPQLPRQAAAVFADTIRQLPVAHRDRKLLQTTVHELGHSLNLAHRFEREVGRADSVSHMAYDWRYVDGPDAFWQRYRFEFDRDELEFLRHGRRKSVVPGGAPFHSVRYWADGDGGYSPYVPESPLPDIALELEPPLRSVLPENRSVFAFGQPVFLQLTLHNMTNEPIDIPRQVLDPKVGLVEVLIRRHRSDDPTGVVDSEPFVPIMQRCMDIDLRAADVVAPGASMTENLNLTFGASGFSFAEPGDYDVTALLVVPEVIDGRVAREFVAASNPLRIRVAHPTSASENEDSLILLDEEVGAWFALGGSPLLSDAGERLNELADRRGDAADDPVVAAIVRTRAFNALREPVRFDGKSFYTGKSDEGEAMKQLEQLTDDALRFFDPETAAGTRELRDRLTS